MRQVFNLSSAQPFHCGIARLPEGGKRQSLEAKARTLLSVLPCRAVPSSAGDHYARIKITRQRAGLSLDENDLWIAASTLAFDATLVTRDRDFQQIEGLKVEDWTV